MVTQVQVPTMHVYDPTSTGEGMSYLQNAPLYSPTGARKFQFPADVGFWDNLVEFVSSTPQKPPIFQVTPSHRQGEGLRVNQQLFAGFVRGWEEQHPHRVTVMSPAGDTCFHASKQFWNDITARLRRGPQLRSIPQENLIAVQSNQDNAPPIYSDLKYWNEAVAQWEAEQRLTPADLAANKLAREKRRQLQQIQVENMDHTRTKHRPRERKHKFRAGSAVGSSVCGSDVAPSDYAGGGTRTRPVAVVDGSRASFSAHPNPHPPGGGGAITLPSFNQNQPNGGFWKYGVLHYHMHQH